MQVVINIDDAEYEEIIYLKNTRPLDLNHYDRMIANGIQLPEGHGRLIDADKLVCEKNNHKGEWHFAYVTKTQIEKCPTIIEAEK